MKLSNKMMLGIFSVFVLLLIVDGYLKIRIIKLILKDLLFIVAKTIQLPIRICPLEISRRVIAFGSKIKIIVWKISSAIPIWRDMLKYLKVELDIRDFSLLSCIIDGMLQSVEPSSKINSFKDIIFKIGRSSLILF